MTKSIPPRYHFPARDRAEEIPGRILRLARRAMTLSKAELTRELYSCAAAAQEHVLGMSTRLTIQERIAERHEYELDDAKREGAQGFVSEAVGDSFDPHGNFVYLLWGTNPSTPLYVGQSTNLFSRIGNHFSNPQKRQCIKSVQFIRCRSVAIMNGLEARLIYQYSPPWNVRGIDPARRTA